MSKTRNDFLRLAFKVLPDCDRRDIWAYFASMHYDANETPQQILERAIYPGIEEEIEGAYGDHLQQSWDNWQNGIEPIVSSKSIDGSTIAGLHSHIRKGS